HLMEADVLRLKEALTDTDLAVRSVEKTPRTQRPRPPFITSTLQQAASGQLRFSPRRTMAAAQQLYENGYITYMRTDSATLSTQALTAARFEIQKRFGDEYLPDAARGYKTSDSRAQEAHEAIRPSGEKFTDPRDLSSDINEDARRLYELIWRRTLASQMPDAQLERTRILLEGLAGDDGQAVFQANGQVVIFDGFLRITNEQKGRKDDDQTFLPPLTSDDSATVVTLDQTEHETRPPDRWTEASLIRELERLGIGRPSTYASILERIQDRYVERTGTALVPRWTAFAVINLMTAHFPELIDPGFTARMEASLDQVASRELDPQPWLSEFYFGASTADPDSHMFPDGLKHRIETSGEQIDARAVSTIPLGSATSGLAVRVGRYGPFIQSPTDESIRAQVPEEMAPDELTTTVATELLEQASQGDRTLGVEPASSLPIFVKVGRNGPYLQVGEAQGDGAKRPRTASIWPTIPVESITLEQALELLQYPRVLGEHPTSGDQVTVQDGPYGPYVRSGTENRSLPGIGDERYTALTTFNLDQAVSLLNAPKESRRGGQQLADLGSHPGSGAPVVVRDGRFGPYVTDGDLNASIPKGRDPSTITIDDAVELLAARADRVAAQAGASRGRRSSRKGSKAKSKAK
ncbi:MAG TPA: DNA topoisomerase I, partial [Chloroflexi bacterium]|nr:DNA topoisomerase I [Chloroflexota bacterium]